MVVEGLKDLIRKKDETIHELARERVVRYEECLQLREALRQAAVGSRKLKYRARGYFGGEGFVLVIVCGSCWSLLFVS